MDTKIDIGSRADIELFIRSFYEKVLQDETISIIFTKVVPMVWEHHIPVIVDFWETILLHADRYRKNAMEPHFDINNKFPLKAVHFEKWLLLFTTAVNEKFEGPVATMAINRARGIAAVMQIKMDEINQRKQ